MSMSNYKIFFLFSSSRSHRISTHIARQIRFASNFYFGFRNSELVENWSKSMAISTTIIVTIGYKFKKIKIQVSNLLQRIIHNFKFKTFVTFHFRLYVIRGNPKAIFPKLFDEWHVEHLTFESDIEPYARQRDVLVEKQAKKFNVNVITMVSHTIYNPDLIIQKNHGVAPTQYQSFLKIVSSVSIPEPVEPPSILPANSKPSKDLNERKDAKCYDCPTLRELGVNESNLGESLYPGGESEGLQRLQTILRDTEWICSFEKPKTSPNSLLPSTTVLSPYLKFGCISSRLMYSDLQKVLKKKKKHTLPPVSLIGQLLWREFFYTAAASEPKFDRMAGNSICRQIPWQKNRQHLDAWTYGRTGYPFIDAIMRQLRHEGWIHHLARHAVACFLTRGEYILRFFVQCTINRKKDFLLQATYGYRGKRVSRCLKNYF